MHLEAPKAGGPKHSDRAFTLAEVVVCIAIIAMAFGAIITAYIQAAKRASWSGYNLAAQALCLQQIEQARAGIWDPVGSGRNDLSSLNLTGWSLTNGVWSGTAVTALNVPVSGTNFTWAVNYVTVSQLRVVPSLSVTCQVVRVDTVWPFNWGSNPRLFTNTALVYFAPENSSGL